MADFLSRLDDHLPPGEVQDYLNKIPYPGVKAVLDNAIMPLNERAEQGVRPDPDNQKASPEVTIGVRPARLATTNITNWKLEQQEDPVLYQAVKHRKASRETCKEALLKVTDRKAVSAYAKSKDQLVMKNGLLYRVLLLSLSWRTGLFIRLDVQLLMRNRSPNTVFSTGTAFCLSPMRTTQLSLVN